MAHHYYAATCYGWAVGSTREQALQRAAGDVGSTIIKRQKASHGGVAASVCRVELPVTAEYRISDYMPVGVPVTEVEHVRIVSVKGATVPRIVE